MLYFLSYKILSLNLVVFNFLNNFHCYSYTNAHTHIFSHKYKYTNILNNFIILIIILMLLHYVL